MKLKKFNIFGISEGWPFWLVDSIVIVASLWAIYYNYFILHAGLGVGLPILITTMLTFLGITAVFYLARWAFSKTIDGQTKQGIFVIFDKRVKENIKNGLLIHSVQNFESIISNIGVEISNLKQFWLDWYNSSNGIEYRVKNKITGMSNDVASSKLEDRFNGAFVIINPEPFVQQSSLGPMAWLTGKVMGLQKGNQAVAVWNPNINPGITGLCNIVRHEMGHMALEALNIPAGDNGDLHHQIFKNSNYGC